MILTEEQARCQICGNRAYGLIWLDDVLPDGSCPDGAVGTVCEHARLKAEGEAWRRKLAPQCFDANGVLIPGKSKELWGAVFEDGNRRRREFAGEG